MARKIGDNNRHLELTVIERTRELEAANDALAKLTFVDGLTGLLNRRAFDRDLVQAICEGDQDELLCLLLCDVDYFKRYNDAYGHLEGDRALQHVANEITRLFPGCSYRYGGEELAAFIRAPDLESCRRKALSLVDAIAALSIPNKTSPHQILTISAGLYPIRGARSAAEVIQATDALLYGAKQQGRNRLVIFRVQAAKPERRARSA
jgi:diguanylate cyclase (GGDEF)-like protein